MAKEKINTKPLRNLIERVDNKCKVCNGAGVGLENKTCKACGGTGKVRPKKSTKS